MIRSVAVYEVYHRLAASLGLQMSCDPGMMTFRFDVAGKLDGHPVQLTRFCGKGAHVEIASPLPLHLDLGLGVTRAGLLSRVAEWLGKEDIQIGEPAFDAAFTVRGDEPGRVRALLGRPVRAELATVHGDVSTLEVTDEGVSLGHSVGLTGHEDLESLTRELWQAVRVAQAVGAAASRVPAAEPFRDHAEAWREHAAAHGLSFSETPLAMGGRAGPTWQRARGLRDPGGRFSVELRASLDVPAPVDVVAATRAPGLSLLAPASQPTGDAAFDAAFSITRATPDGVLHEDVRRRLLELAATGRVWFGGSDVTVLTPASVPASDVLGLFEALRSLLALVAERARVRGAYR